MFNNEFNFSKSAVLQKTYTFTQDWTLFALSSQRSKTATLDTFQCASEKLLT